MKTALKTSMFQLQTCLVAAFLLSATASAPAAQAVWTAVVGTSADTNWSDLSNWGGVNPSGNNCVFNDATGVGNNTTINNVVNTAENPVSVLYTNIGTFQNTLILPGNTLMVGTGGLTMGNGNQFGTNPSSAPTATISGAGATLIVSNGPVTVGFAYQATTGGTIAVLNMSDLDNFIATNITALSIGSGSTRMAGYLYLGTNNFISFTNASSSTSPNITIGSNSSNNGPGAALYLGQTNTFFVNDIGMGLKKQESGGGGQMLFNPAFNNPVAYFYGTNGVNSRVATWAIGDGQTQSGTITCQGTANFTGGSVYAYVNDMWLGRNSTADSGSGPTSSGTLTLSAGQFNVNYMTNGWIINATESPVASGTINVNGTAVLSVNNSLVLATTNSGLTGLATNLTEAQGMLIISNGTVLANNILSGGMGNSGNGYGAYIQMTGGTLAVTNTMGTSAFPINYLTLANSPTFQFSVANGVTNAQIQDVFSDNSTVLVNISSLPVIPAYPSTFPLMTYQYSTASGVPFSLGTLPGTFSGYVSNDNSSTVWLVVTNGPALPKLCQWGGGVNDDWDTTSLNWTNNGSAVAYAEGDLVLFNDSAQTAAVNLTAPHAPLAWTVTNNVLNYTFTGSGVQGSAGLVKSGTASSILSESGDTFSGGISVLAGTLVLDQASAGISGGLSIASGATAQIGNGDANGALPAGALVNDGTLAYDQSVYTLVSTPLSGVGALTQEGSGTLALGAANTYTGNTLVSGGTLALTNAGSISDSAAITVNRATFDVSAESATTLNNLTLANASLNVGVPYGRTPVSVSALTLGGTGNTINIASLPPIAAYPATITLIQSATAVGGSDVSLGAVPSASPAYAGSVSVSGSQVILTLTAGPIGVRPYVDWTGADISNLHTNWSDNLNWQTPAAPTAGESVVFNGTDTQAASALSTPGGGASALNFAEVNNIADTSFTIASLIYTNLGGTYHNTFIDNGATLTITNNNTNAADIFSVGSSSVDYGETATNHVTVSGPQAIVSVSNTNDNFFVGMESATGSGALGATLDMSALGTLNATVSAFEIGALPQDSDYLSGSAYLAQTNVITAVGGTNDEAGQNEPMSFMVGENGKTGSAECFLYLGQQNKINANYIGVGLAKQSADMLFNPIWANPSVTIRAGDGVSPVVDWDIGDGLDQSGASSSPRGTNDFTGGTVNALVTLMNLGRSPGPSGADSPSEGTLTFGAGTISVGTLYAGYQFYANNDFGVGTINVNGTGLLQVGSLNLGITAGSSTNVTTGMLNINGATAELGTVTAGLSSRTNTASVINLAGGTLVISNTAGVASAPLTELSLAGGRLQLNVNGSSTATNIVATTVTTSGTTTLSIGALTGVATGITYPLISYTGTDPYSGLSLSLPAGYQGNLVDNAGVVGLQLTVAPPSSPPRFTTISVSGTTLTISGTNGTAGGSFILLETTNLVPPIHWTPALTNSYNGNGAFSLSANIINPATPDEFFTFTNVP